MTVALTAYALPENRLRAREAGCRIHSAKPVDPRELLRALAAVVRPAVA